VVVTVRLTIATMRALSVIGVPSSAGSYAAGQEQAPAALRSAGLIDALDVHGLSVHDEGDLPVQTWHPDRINPRMQNIEQVIRSITELIERLRPLVARGDNLLVLGGNCTIVLGVVSALRELAEEPTGLLYVDRGYDLNTPESTTDGALDWMGMAHALALPGSIELLLDALGPPPLLGADQVVWLGVEESMATEWERTQARRLGLHAVSSEALARHPATSTIESLAHLPGGPLAVHFDVDVLDFTDAPLAENTDGRNTGPTLDQAAEALQVATGDRRFRALSIGELNPTRSAGDPDAIPRFVAVLASVMAASAGP
jgi:arginase